MWSLLCCLLLPCLLHHTQGHKTYGDMFQHKHSPSGWFPFPIPPIPGWDPDSTPWDDSLYPPLEAVPNQLQRNKGKTKVVLTSDSPALNGSSITFTAQLQFPPCQTESSDGDLLWDDHCEDANGQLRSGYVYSWSSWLEDYGFGKCQDTNQCNVFPDGKPFPQSNDWRHKNYVYVWHTRGQYYETCDGHSSSLSLNTSWFPLGAEVMEVLVYRQRERRKYSPMVRDTMVYHITDKIPVTVSLSQKSATNMSDGVFFRGEELLLQVQLHDPSKYLKSAASVDFLWDFRDGNQLVTHRDTITHTYSTPGRRNVKLVVEAAFPIVCPSPMPTAPPTPHPEGSTVHTGTHALTARTDPTHVTGSSSPPSQPPTSSSSASTSGLFSTEPLPSEGPFTTGPWLHRQPSNTNQCFRYVHGSFSTNVSIIAEPKPAVRTWPSSKIVDVTTARETKTDFSFIVQCLGSTPTSACTIISDSSCSEVKSVRCEDLPPTTSPCMVLLRRSFPGPGTYCVNISLADSSSVGLASTTVTILKTQEEPEPQRPHIAAVVISSSAVLTALFALVAFMVYRRRRVYRPVRRILPDEALSAGVRGHVVRLRDSLFPRSEESRQLLPQPCAL
ncbi:unnamed protein product [Knipowitschia caucasica]|uniref:PKD domain-containing protein n=1 Tax=Knipowitschia caucasica TaxID=637954 RepID=A0AAV2K7A4_KNICA